MHMRWWRRDVAIASRCAEASFSLTEEDEVECIKGVDNFKYLGRMLYRLDDDWPVVRRNVRKAHQVCIRLGKLLQMEGADSLVSAMFYRELMQAVLIFGLETWFLLALMSKNLERLHVGFLRKVAGSIAKRQRGRTWRSVAAVSVLKEAVTQTLGTYIDKWKSKVADWVELSPILEVYNR